MARTPAGPLFEVRKSKVHGKGVFALQHIPKGTRLIEYLGERVSHKEADRRYADKDERDNHTFLFTVNARVVIDAGVDGNDARFFNHSCDPNCESVIEDGRVWIETVRDIAPGDEMTYDYQIVREETDPPNIDEIFACRCGAPHCRGTMLSPPKKKRKAARKSKVAVLVKSKLGPKSKVGGRRKAKTPERPAGRKAARR